MENKPVNGKAVQKEELAPSASTPNKLPKGKTSVKSAMKQETPAPEKQKEVEDPPTVLDDVPEPEDEKQDTSKVDDQNVAEPMGDAAVKKEIDWTKYSNDAFYVKYSEAVKTGYENLPDITKGKYAEMYTVGKRMFEIKQETKKKAQQKPSTQATATAAIAKMASMDIPKDGSYVVKKDGKVIINFTSAEYRSKLLGSENLTNLTEPERQRAQRVLTRERMEMIPGPTLSDKNVACLAKWESTDEALHKLFNAAGYKDIKQLSKSHKDKTNLGANVKNAGSISLINGTIMALEIAKETGAENPTWRNFLHAFRPKFEAIAIKAASDYRGSTEDKRAINSGFFFGLAFSSPAEAMKFWVMLAFPAVVMTNDGDPAMNEPASEAVFSKEGRPALRAAIKNYSYIRQTTTDIAYLKSAGSGAIVIDPKKILSFTSDPNNDLKAVSIQCSYLLEQWLKRNYILSFHKDDINTNDVETKMRNREDSPYVSYLNTRSTAIANLKISQMKRVRREERRPMTKSEQSEDAYWAENASYLD